ncbi:MAG: hypothetical protein Tsb0020_24360 [Haliangiales bacterium]
MTKSSDKPKLALASAVIAALVGLLIYQTVELVKADERALASTEALAEALADAMAAGCPECPPAQPPPLFPELYKPVEFSVDFYGMSYHGNSDNLIDRHVLFFGAYEKDVLHLMRDLSQAVGGGVFVDVGANTGLHSLYMSRHAREVHAFEPYEPVLARLRAAIARNHITNIVVHPVGLGDQAARVVFHKPPERNLGSGSFVAEFQPGNEPAEDLEIVVGDAALAAAKVERVDLIKIDIEGYEQLALRGLRQTLERSRPVVIVEVTANPDHDETFKSEAALRAAFPDRYQFLLVRQTARRGLSGEYQLLPYDFDMSVGQRMLVVYPSERAQVLGLPAGS